MTRAYDTNTLRYGDVISAIERLLHNKYVAIQQARAVADKVLETRLDNDIFEWEQDLARVKKNAGLA